MNASTVALIYFFRKPAAPWRVQVARRLQASSRPLSGWIAPGRYFLGPVYSIALARRDRMQTLCMH
ncbi:hypothetical protein [Dyella koreensis]|uniref:Uncharacterized protein n=1 Tax=Dyella koreensis TaxID=311235 RepID=A0ABW8K469_9GAMM